VKLKIEEIIDIPEGIEAVLDGKILVIKKDNKKSERKIPGDFKLKIDNKKITLVNEKASKNQKRQIKSIAAHIRNMLKGFSKKYTYKLQVCYVHFPISISLSGKELVVKNFLGEKKERRAKILEDVDVKIEKEIIILESFNKEKAGQTAANIEKSTRITKRDRRIFQDGIFITEKCKGRMN
jgi:large subunit ribosomal protein L6